MPKGRRALSLVNRLSLKGKPFGYVIEWKSFYLFPKPDPPPREPPPPNPPEWLLPPLELWEMWEPEWELPAWEIWDDDPE